MADHISMPQETNIRFIDESNAAEQSKGEEVIEHPEVQTTIATASSSESKPGDAPATTPTTEEKGKGKEDSIQDENTMEFMIESEPQEGNPTAEEKGKGKEDSIQDENIMEIMTESEPQEGNPTAEENGKDKGQPVHPSSMYLPGDGGVVGEATDMPSEGQIGPEDIQSQLEGQNTIPAPSNEMVPPPVPLPQDPGSETVSINASSISNPVLEVDNAVGASFVYPDFDRDTVLILMLGSSRFFLILIRR